jgi:hypothetical protein
MGYINCISPSLSPSVLDQSLCLREHLLLALLLILVELLLATHAVNHIKHIDRGNIDLLLLGGERSLGTLQPLLLVFLFLGRLLGVFADGSLVGVSEEHGLLLWWLVVYLSLFIFLNQDAINSLINPLRRCLLKVLLI